MENKVWTKLTFVACRVSGDIERFKRSWMKYCMLIFYYFANYSTNCHELGIIFSECLITFDTTLLDFISSLLVWKFSHAQKSYKRVTMELIQSRRMPG